MNEKQSEWDEKKYVFIEWQTTGMVGILINLSSNKTFANHHLSDRVFILTISYHKFILWMNVFSLLNGSDTLSRLPNDNYCIN